MIRTDKLKIIKGEIHYCIRQQDGQMQQMRCKDAMSNRMFVSWVQIHD